MNKTSAPKQPSFICRAGQVAVLASLFILLLPSIARPFPDGGGNISIFHRYTHQYGSLAPPLVRNESLLRLDLFQTVPGYGRFFSSTDLTRNQATDTGEYTSLSRYQFGLEGLQLGKSVSSIILGDTSIRFTNLVDSFTGPFPSLYSVKPIFLSPYRFDNNRFANATYPDTYFRGGVINNASENNSLTLFGGRLGTPKGFQSNEFDFPDDQLIYGFTWGKHWSKKLFLGIGLAGTKDQPRDSTPNAPKIDNTILLIDGAYLFTDNLKLVGELRDNFFSSNNGSINDWALRIGPVITHGRGGAEFNYRRMGANFLQFRDILQPERDLQGFFATGDYRLSENISLYSSFDWNSSNLEDNNRLPAIDTFSGIFGGFFYAPHLVSLNMRFSITNRSSRPISSIYLENRTYLTYLEIMRQFRILTPYLRLQGEWLDEKATPGTSSTTGTFTAGLRLTPFSNLFIYLEGEEQIGRIDAGTSTNVQRLRSGLSASPLSWMAVNADLDYSHTTTSPFNSTQDTIGAGTGVTLTLPHNYQLRSDFRYTYGTIETPVASGATLAKLVAKDGFLTSDSSVLQVTVALSKRFGWGDRQLSPLGGQAGMVAGAEAGDIEGYVFFDLNLNGKKDPGEPGLSGATILLENGLIVKTGPDGSFVLSNVTTGIHQVRLNERDLGATINLLAPAMRRIELANRDTIQLSFPLITAGLLRGRVVIDNNDNGVADPTDTPLPDIMIFLAGTKINTFTDSDGAFVIDNLIPGRYELKLDRTGLAADMTLITPDTISVEIYSGKETVIPPFNVSVEKKQVIRKQFKQSPISQTQQQGALPQIPPPSAKPVSGKKRGVKKPVKNRTTATATATGVQTTKQASALSAASPVLLPAAGSQQGIIAKSSDSRISRPGDGLEEVSLSGAASKMSAPTVLPDSDIQRSQSAPLPARKEADKSLAIEPLSDGFSKRIASPLLPEPIVIEVFFRFDSAEVVSGDDQALVYSAKRLIKLFPASKVAIEGHTDIHGSIAYNKKLGLKRARSLAAALKESRKKKTPLTVRSYGKRKPVCTGIEDSCQAQNRRGVIKLH